MSALYRVSVGGTPMPSDVNQFADALSGDADVGAITLAPAIDDPSTAIGLATATTGTALGVGAYLYAMTFVTGILRDNGTVEVSGETLPSSTTAMTTTTNNQVGSLTSIPNSADATVVAKRLYRTVVDGAQLKLVATIAAGLTSYIDTTADADLGANAPTSNTTGTYIDGARIINVPTPIDAGDVANKSFVETEDAKRIARGTANTDIERLHSLIQPIDTRTVEYGYLNGLVSTETIKDGSTVIKTTTFNYTSGTLTSVVEVVDGLTITTTINYNPDGTIASTPKAVT